jgi:hypothetical protein
MSIWNKVLVGLTIVVGLAYLFFAARALKARSYWGESLRMHEEALAAVAKEKELLLEGNPAEGRPGVRQLSEEVHRMVIGRGRVWRGSAPKLVNAAGQATVMTQLPAPHRDALKAQMFVFEEPSAQSPGAFLGEFTVAAVADRQWQLQPVRPMTEVELERLRRSRSAWSLYEVMPGEPAEEGQPPQVGTDYHVLFSDYYRLRASLDDLIGTTTADTQSLENAVASANQGAELVQKDIAAAKEELKVTRDQRDLVTKHLAQLKATFDRLKDAVQKYEQANRAAASQLAGLQLEAIRRIDQRTKVARAAAPY